MSLSLTNVQQTEFDELVKIEYRSRGFLLRHACRLRSDVIGATMQFRKVGQVIANPVGYQNLINIQDPNFTAANATLVKYAAGTGVDSIQDLTVNFDSKRELAMLVAMAVGRRADQIIINALAANPGQTIAAGGTNFTYAKFRQIAGYFEANAVPREERHIALTGNNLAALLADDHFTSRWYSNNDAFVNGTLDHDKVLGMTVHIIPTMTEGGLPLVGTVRTCFAWHNMAVGMAIGQDMRVEVNYLPQSTTYFVNGLFFAGATVIDNRGVFAINCDESVNP